MNTEESRGQKSAVSGQVGDATTALTMGRVAQALRMSARFNREAIAEAQAALKLATESGDERLISACNHYCNALTLGNLEIPVVGELELCVELLRKKSYTTKAPSHQENSLVSPCLGAEKITSEFGDMIRRENSGHKLSTAHAA